MLGYIHTPFPFNSVHGGIQLLSWNLLLSAGSEQPVAQPLQLYPNPANGLVHFSLPVSTDELFTVEVIDAFGRLVKSETINPKTNGRQGTIDLTGFAPGIYSIRVSGKTVTQSGRVVKC